MGGMNIALRYVKGDKKQGLAIRISRIEGGGVLRHSAFLVTDLRRAYIGQYYPPVVCISTTIVSYR